MWCISVQRLHRVGTAAVNAAHGPNVVCLLCALSPSATKVRSFLAAGVQDPFVSVLTVCGTQSSEDVLHRRLKFGPHQNVQGSISEVKPKG
jgi:hypothetical protein